jgi:membrane carboxypeptidase/penicillin-binding protein
LLAAGTPFSWRRNHFSPRAADVFLNLAGNLHSCAFVLEARQHLDETAQQTMLSWSRRSMRSSKGDAAPAKTPSSFTLCQVPEISGALVVMDPHSGRVLAISGGFSFEISQFNRATQAKRQPGSSIKPFVYLTALDHGFTPSTLVVDGPISLPQGPGLPMWSPTDYANRYHGPKYRGATPLRGHDELLKASYGKG